MNVLKTCLVGLTVLAGAGVAVADFASTSQRFAVDFPAFAAAVSNGPCTVEFQNRGLIIYLK